MLCKEIKVKSALHRLNVRYLPYHWDMNIYRGCSHRCQYCYALYSHSYLKTHNEFFDEIQVKTNIAEELDRELRSNHWRGEIINLGGVTDSYQPIEAKYQLTRQVWQVLLKRQNPATICTKSDLVLRDLDIISQLAKKTYVNVTFTITAADEKTRTQIEPGAPPSARRFAALAKLKAAGVSTGVHLMPILPLINDSRENLDSIIAQSREARVSHFLVGMLNLRGQTKDHFLNFLRKNFPEHYQSYLDLYFHGGLRAYQDKIYQLIDSLRRQYKLTDNYWQPIRQKLGLKKQGKLL